MAFGDSGGAAVPRMVAAVDAGRSWMAAIEWISRSKMQDFVRVGDRLLLSCLRWWPIVEGLKENESRKGREREDATELIKEVARFSGGSNEFNMPASGADGLFGWSEYGIADEGDAGLDVGVLVESSRVVTSASFDVMR